MTLAVCWDYDNTIFRTLDSHFNKHKTVLERYGIKLSEIFRQKIYENNGEQNFEWMQKELGLKVPKEKYLTEVDEEFFKHMKELEMRPGVKYLIEEINRRKIPQAIITNARRNSAKPVLDEKGITPFMKKILFKEDYEGRKPDPAPYLAGLKAISEITHQELDPKRCIAIEDDPLGVKSAKAAGMVVIHRKLNEQDLDCQDADYCCFHEKEFVNLVLKLLDKS